MVKVYLEYKDGFVEEREVSHYIRGVRRMEHGGRPFNVYVESDREDVTPQTLNSLYQVHHPKGGVYFKGSEEFTIFKMEHLLGAAGEY